MYLASCIAPIHVDAEVSFAFTIMGDRAVLFEDRHKVLYIFLALIFYAKSVKG